MHQDAHLPTGLGGWLWPVTWLSAVMPVLFSTLVVHMAVEHMPRVRDMAWPYSAAFHAYELPAIVFSGVGLCFSTWWAMQWFARAPRLVTWGPPALTAWVALVTALLWPERDEPPVIVTLVAAWCAATLAWWAARRSARVRDAFTALPRPVAASGVRGVLLGGPEHWGALRWLLPGVVVYTAVNLWLDLQVSVDAALEPLPEGPPPTNAFAAIGDPSRYILASRQAVGLQVSAVLALLGALVALARGSRSFPLWAVVAVLLALGAPLRMSLRDWCCPFLDGPEFERAARAWLTVLALAVIGALAWRRPRATPHAE